MGNINIADFMFNLCKTLNKFNLYWKYLKYISKGAVKYNIHLIFVFFEKFDFLITLKFFQIHIICKYLL